MNWMEKYEKAANGQKNTAKKKKRPEPAVKTTSGGETTASGGSSGWKRRYVIEMHENKEIEPSSPQDSQNGGRSGVPNSSTTSIRNSEPEVNQMYGN